MLIIIELIHIFGCCCFKCNIIDNQITNMDTIIAVFELNAALAIGAELEYLGVYAHSSPSALQIYKYKQINKNKIKCTITSCWPTLNANMSKIVVNKQIG